MRRIYPRAILSLLIPVAVSCSPTVPVEVSDLPQVAGEWAYSANEIRLVGRTSGAVCEIEGMRLHIGPWRSSGFYGRSEGGYMACTLDLEPLSGPLTSYPVRRGGAVLNFIAFDIGTPAWRHDGTLAGDTMSGSFGIEQGGIRMEGRFRAVRIP